MLLNNLYFLDDLEVSEHQINATVRIEPSHEILKAHFPTQAVVPGICMMEMIKDVLSEGLKKELHLKQSSVIKFLNVWTPEQTTQVQLQLNIKPKEIGLSCDAQLTFGELVFMKLKGDYQ